MKGDGARALMVKDNNILMIHRFRDGHEYYVLPGGHIEDGESSEQAVIRELNEETSIAGRVIKKLETFTDKDSRVHHIYECEYLSGSPKLEQNSDEAKRSSKDNVFKPIWVSESEVPGLVMWPEETKQILIDYLKK